MNFSRNDTIFLRFLAICFIVNSHLDSFYPIKYLATGGMIGNSLFFMISSLGLYLSWQKNVYTFSTWYIRRIVRIYPPVWVIVLLLIIPCAIFNPSAIYLNLYNKGMPFAEVLMFFMPPFWFLQALLVYYFFIYPMLKRYSPALILKCAIPLCLIYIIHYLFYLDLSKFSIEDLPFKLIFYLLVFLFGLYLGYIKEKISYGGIHDYMILSLCIIIIYLQKYIMLNGKLSSFQFIQHLFVFPMLFYFLKISNSTFIKFKIMESYCGKNIINFISTMTLEIYIVTGTIGNPIRKLDLLFPMNIFFYISCSLLIAYMVHNLAKIIQSFLEKILPIYKKSFS